MVVQCATYTTPWRDPGGGQAVTCNEGQKVIHIVGEKGLSHDSGKSREKRGPGGEVKQKKLASLPNEQGQNQPL